MIYIGEDKEGGVTVYEPVLQRLDGDYCYLMWSGHKLQNYSIAFSKAGLDHTPIGPTSLVQWAEEFVDYEELYES